MHNFSQIVRGGVFLLALAGIHFNAAATTEDVINKTFDAGDQDQLLVDAGPSRVDVRPSGDSKAYVIITRRVTDSDEEAERDILAKDEVTVTQDGDTVRVKVSVPKTWFARGPRRDYSIEVKVPARFSAEIDASGGSLLIEGLEGEIDADTSGGSIQLRHLPGAVKANTSGGGITLVDCTGGVRAETSGGDVDSANGRGRTVLRTSGGSIWVQNHTGDIELSTSGGGIRVRGVDGAVSAHTSGGGIEAAFKAGLNGDCDLETTGGSIRVELPESAALEIDAATTGGSVTTELPGFRPETSGGLFGKVKGPVNGGGPLLKLRTTGGSIRIAKYGK